MKLLSLCLLAAVSLSINTYASFPDNSQNIPVNNNKKSLVRLTEDVFLQWIEVFKKQMGPVVAKRYSKELTVQPHWEDSRVKAWATRDMEDNAVINITGGLARHPLMTQEAFTLLLCHELGHQFGGAPKKMRGRSDLRSWSSAEGQADYYAATRCFPQFVKAGIFKKTKEHAPSVYKVCLTDQCTDVVEAGLSVARLFHDVTSVGDVPGLEQKDSRKVFRTIYKHPRPQCRLDTFVSGANCDMSALEKSNIDDSDPLVGVCPTNPDENREGGRPACWFSAEKF
jgi:hypothetical protein